MQEIFQPIPFQKEKPLDQDELQVIETLVKSGAWPVLKRLIQMQRNQLLSDLLTRRPDEVQLIQGRIQGLQIVENIPVIMAKQYEELKKRQEKADDQKQKKSMHARAKVEKRLG